MTTLEAQHQVITDLILENKKLKQERDEARKELEEYRSIAENIGAVKAVS